MLQSLFWLIPIFTFFLFLVGILFVLSLTLTWGSIPWHRGLGVKRWFLCAVTLWDLLRYSSSLIAMLRNVSCWAGSRHGSGGKSGTWQGLFAGGGAKSSSGITGLSSSGITGVSSIVLFGQAFLLTMFAGIGFIKTGNGCEKMYVLFFWRTVL